MSKTELDRQENAEQWLLQQLRGGAKRSSYLLREGEKAGHSATSLYAVLWRCGSVVAIGNGLWAIAGPDSGGTPMRCTYGPFGREGGFR